MTALSSGAALADHFETVLQQEPPLPADQYSHRSITQGALDLLRKADFDAVYTPVMPTVGNISLRKADYQMIFSVALLKGHVSGGPYMETYLCETPDKKVSQLFNIRDDLSSKLATLMVTALAQRHQNPPAPII